MTWAEISKWAKEKGFKISRKEGSVGWQKLDNSDISGCEPDLESAAKAIFNEVSGHRWVEYQQEYEKKSADGLTK